MAKRQRDDDGEVPVAAAECVSSAQAENVTDKTMDFEIKSRHSSIVNGATMVECPINFEPQMVHSHVAFDGHQETIRMCVNSTKRLIDALSTQEYYAARDRVFPLAESGSQGSKLFSNRAGHKLFEVMQVIGVWEHLVRVAKERNVRRISFADICGGPGAFSQLLLHTVPKFFTQLQGFGMTLLTDSSSSLSWYPSLTRRGDFIATYGVDGTGTIYNLGNIEALGSLAQSHGALPLMLAVADGGFDVTFDLAHVQETISARLVYGQWLAAALILEDQGCFVLKLFDTFSPFSRSVLYLSTIFYRRVFVVKPKHSRVVNSERYLVGVGFRKAQLTPAWREYLCGLHTEKGFMKDGAAEADRIPLTLTPYDWITVDESFVASTDAMNGAFGSRQSIAIEMVLKAVSDSQRAPPTKAAAAETSP